MVEHITLVNMATDVILELDKVTTPYYILDSVTWGEVEGTHHSYKYVNQIGVHVTGTSLGTREVEITGWIIAETELQMTDRKTMLNRFVNPQQAIEMTYGKYQLKFLPNSSIKYSAVVPENNDIMCKFKILGLAADPLFEDKQTSVIPVARTKALFHFPLIINKTEQRPPSILFGVREPSLIVNIVNSGAVSTGMRIVFNALGTLTGPSLINVLTQEYFKVNKTMQQGETVEIVTTMGEKKVFSLIDGVETNYFRYRDLDSTWLQLNVGNNVFRYNADEGIDNLEVYIYFTNKYLEVQECY